MCVKERRETFLDEYYVMGLFFQAIDQCSTCAMCRYANGTTMHVQLPWLCSDAGIVLHISYHIYIYIVLHYEVTRALPPGSRTA